MNHPPVITISIGGMLTIPSHGWFLTWFYHIIPPFRSIINVPTLLVNDIGYPHVFPYYWFIILVGGIPTPLKNMTSSVGMMTFPTHGKTIQMFQTTNQ